MHTWARLTDLATFRRVEATHEVRVRTSSVDDTLGLYFHLVALFTHSMITCVCRSLLHAQICTLYIHGWRHRYSTDSAPDIDVDFVDLWLSLHPSTMWCFSAFVCLSVCLSLCRLTPEAADESDENLCTGETSNSWLDSAADPDHDEDSGMLKECLPVRDDVSHIVRTLRHQRYTSADVWHGVIECF